MRSDQTITRAGCAQLRYTNGCTIPSSTLTTPSPITVPPPPSLPSFPVIQFSLSFYLFSYYYSYVSETSTSYFFIFSILCLLFNLRHCLSLSLHLVHLTRSSNHMRNPPTLFCLASPHRSHCYHPLHLCPSHFLHLVFLHCSPTNSSPLRVWSASIYLNREQYSVLDQVFFLPLLKKKKKRMMMGKNCEVEQQQQRWRWRWKR